MNCGQIAVAVLTGRTVAEVEAFVGHSQATRGPELVMALWAFGFDFQPPWSRKPRSTGLGLMYTRAKGERRMGHWTAVRDGVMWDSGRR